MFKQRAYCRDIKRFSEESHRARDSTRSTFSILFAEIIVGNDSNVHALNGNRSVHNFFLNIDAVYRRNPISLTLSLSVSLHV